MYVGIGIAMEIRSWVSTCCKRTEADNEPTAGVLCSKHDALHRIAAVVTRGDSRRLIAAIKHQDSSSPAHALLSYHGQYRSRCSKDESNKMYSARAALAPIAHPIFQCHLCTAMATNTVSVSTASALQCVQCCLDECYIPQRSCCAVALDPQTARLQPRYIQ